MICFTSDIDWASEEVIYDTLKIFEEFRIKCTFFATHESEVLKKCNKDLFEVGLHPNFNDGILNGKGKGAKKIISELIKIYPNSIGIRSHSLTHNSRLLNIYNELGILYESNTLIPYDFRLKPFRCWSTLTRIPYNWEDDVHYLYDRAFDEFVFADYNPEKSYIFDYHPIHVFLNTDSQTTYDNAKIFLNNPDKLLDFRNKNNIGVRDHLISHLKFVKDRKLKSFNLKELIL